MPSPWMSGLRARIISCIWLFLILVRSSLIFSFSAVTPSGGSIFPPRTW